MKKPKDRIKISEKEIKEKWNNIKDFKPELKDQTKYFIMEKHVSDIVYIYHKDKKIRCDWFNGIEWCKHPDIEVLYWVNLSHFPGDPLKNKFEII